MIYGDLMLDPIAAALEMLDAEVPKKGITALAAHPNDYRRRSYNVPTMNGLTGVAPWAFHDRQLCGPSAASAAIVSSAV